MTFGFPAAFWFAMLALPVAAAFFYRRRATERMIPALEIWEMLGVPVASKSISSLLRRLLSLLAQLLLLILLILALADPEPAKKRAARTVIVLDESATLQTRDGSADRFSSARHEALRALAEIPSEGQAVVLCATHTPVLAQGVTHSMADARKAVESAQSVDVNSDLARAVEAARAFLDPQIACDVVVISDFAALDPAEMRRNWHESAHLKLVQVGKTAPDAAIASLWAESRGAERHITARISQKGMTGQTVPVRLSVNGQVAETRSVMLADLPVQVEFSQAMPPGATYEVAMDSNDALAVDDRALGVVPGQELRSVCLVTSGNPPLERALLADPSIRLRIVTPAAYHGPGTDRVVVIDGPGVTERDPGAASYLFIGTADSFGWGKVADTSSAPTITHWVGDHPAMLDVDPTLMRVGKALKMRWASNVTAAELVAADDVWLAAEVSPTAPAEGRSARYLYWLFDLRDSDLPRRLSFPLLLWNAIDYLATGGQEPPPDSSLTGRPLHLIASSTRPPIVSDPAGRALVVEAAADGWSVADTLHQGIYRRADSGENFAVNLLSDRGTLPLPADSSASRDVDNATNVAPASLWLRFRKQLTWRSVLAAVAALAAVEWLLFNRRLIRIG